jgi:hypothetical protein
LGFVSCLPDPILRISNQTTANDLKIGKTALGQSLMVAKQARYVCISSLLLGFCRATGSLISLCYWACRNQFVDFLNKSFGILLVALVVSSFQTRI